MRHRLPDRLVAAVRPRDSPAVSFPRAGRPPLGDSDCCDTCPYTPACEEERELLHGDDWGEEYDIGPGQWDDEDYAAFAAQAEAEFARRIRAGLGIPEILPRRLPGETLTSMRSAVVMEPVSADVLARITARALEAWEPLPPWRIPPHVAEHLDHARAGEPCGCGGAR
jgi:hypothetical protein